MTGRRLDHTSPSASAYPSSASQPAPASAISLPPKMKPPDAMPIASRRMASLCSGWRRLLGNAPMPSKYHIVTKRKACGKRTYTFPDQSVYGLPAIGIRYAQQGYTFCPAPSPSALSDGSTSSLLRAFYTINRESRLPKNQTQTALDEVTGSFYLCYELDDASSHSPRGIRPHAKQQHIHY